jgi:hypothetical protein
MNRGVVLVLLVGSVSLFGCDRLMKERKKVESLLASASAAAASASAALAQLPTAAPTPMAPAAPAVSDDQIPAPEDYEQQAAKDITAANMQAELDKLKRDIGP